MEIIHTGRKRGSRTTALYVEYVRLCVSCEISEKNDVENLEEPMAETVTSSIYFCCSRKYGPAGYYVMTLAASEILSSPLSTAQYLCSR